MRHSEKVNICTVHGCGQTEASKEGLARLPRTTFRLTSFGFLCLALSGCFLLQDRGSLSLTWKGNINCQVVDLPGERWQADPKIEEQAHTAIDLGNPLDEAEFAISRTQPVEILVAMRAYPGHYGGVGSFYSRDKYGFRMGRAGVHLSSDDAWGQADVLKREEQQPAEQSDEFYQRNATYQGKGFPRSGQFYYGSQLSEHGRWIAVYSYDGHQTPKEERRDGSIIGGGKGPDPATGILHIDLYNVATGEKTARLEGPFTDYPYRWYVAGTLVGDRYYVIGTRFRYRHFIFCELPASEKE